MRCTFAPRSAKSRAAYRAPTESEISAIFSFGSRSYMRTPLAQDRAHLNHLADRQAGYFFIAVSKLLEHIRRIRAEFRRFRPKPGRRFAIFDRVRRHL